MSPANFLATNPDAQNRLIESGGESLRAGVRNMLEDLTRGKISQTDETAFEVGRNVAATEGAVVYENEFFQLLQYKPLTDKVYARPLLLVPPCINKFYILDLQPESSLVRHAVEQGHTVFWCRGAIPTPPWPSGRGTTTSSTRPSAPSKWRATSAVRTRSTYSASAWAARSFRPRSRCWRRAANTRRPA